MKNKKSSSSSKKSIDKSKNVCYNIDTVKERKRNTMTSLIEKMIDNVVRRYGHEDKKTIQFCTIAEKGDYRTTVEEYNKLMR